MPKKQTADSDKQAAKTEKAQGEEQKIKKTAKSKKEEKTEAEVKPAKKAATPKKATAAKKETDKKAPAKKAALKTEKTTEVAKETKPEAKAAAAAKPEPVKKEGSKLKDIKSRPQSMEELLEMTGYTLSVPKPGTVLQGLVTDVTKKMVLVDIGAKTEGMVVDREFEAARDFIADINPGDEVSVYVISPENDRGQILLSLKRALVDRKWEQFTQYLQTGEAVSVKGLEVNKGGMIVLAEGIRGFVPSSQFGKDFLGKMDLLIEKSFKVKVIEVDKEKNRLIFSERLVSEADEIAKKAEALKFVSAGDVFEGVVSGIMPFGVFIGVEVPLKDSKDEMGKVEGLVHISEISWEKVNDPNDYFKLGDRVKVKVLGIDEDAGKLNLSVKQMSDDPWKTVETKYPVGAKVTGRVTRTAPFGSFVTLEPGVDGLIHISKIPSGNEPQVGADVEIFVENIDVEQRRMSLGVVLTEVPVGYK
jgi:small subunit ribosomal protein S1